VVIAIRSAILHPADAPAKGRARKGSKVVTHPAPEPDTNPGLIAEAIVQAAASAWDLGVFGHFETPWLPTASARPERKLLHLVHLIDQHIAQRFTGWRVDLEGGDRPSAVVVRNVRDLPALRIPISMPDRQIAIGHTYAVLLTNREVGRRVLEQLAALVAAHVGER
jgi:hypothetical protein